MKRTRLRFRSKKTEKVYRDERRALVQSMLGNHVPCERCYRHEATEVHELKSRARGGSITDPENCVALCHTCHRWVTEHPKEARETGWLRNSWD